MHRVFKARGNPVEPDYDWNAFYNGYFLQRRWKRAVAKAVWGMVPRSSNLLDVGCGSSPIISRYPGATGVDPDVKKLEFMRKRLPYCHFLQGYAEKLCFPGNCFDHVLCVEVLEHLGSPQRAVAEIARVTRPGGSVVIATPETQGIRGRIWRLAEHFTPYKDEHQQKLGRRQVERLAAASGLIPVRHQYVMWCDYVGLFKKPERTPSICPGQVL